MVKFFLPGDLYRALRGDLDEAEGAGFFLAQYLPDEHVFRLHRGRRIPEGGFESRSDFYLVLRDEMKAEIIKWAWDEGASLVEAHSHAFGPARFSPSDIDGFDEWVPHLWWRLRGRPYGALVVAEGTFDALAWIERAEAPEQVDALEVAGEGSVPTTRRTLTSREAKSERDRER
jgi:hypothetical protein